MFEKDVRLKKKKRKKVPEIRPSCCGDRRWLWGPHTLGFSTMALIHYACPLRENITATCAGDTSFVDNVNILDLCFESLLGSH